MKEYYCIVDDTKIKVDGMIIWLKYGSRIQITDTILIPLLETINKVDGDTFIDKFEWRKLKIKKILAQDE